MNNLFSSIPPHLTMNILKTVEVIHVWDLYHVGSIVCPTLHKPGESITETLVREPS